MFIDEEEVIKSVRRVFEMLEWFDRARVSVSATTLAHALSYPVSSTNALLKSMASRGYLCFDPLAKEYFPTLQLSRSHNWMDRGWYGSGPLHALVHELQEETGQFVTLSCQNDLGMVFVDVAEHEGGPVPVKAGDAAPLFQSAIGLAALIHRTDRQVGQLIHRYNRRTYRPSAKADPDAVLRQLRQARREGLGVGYGLYVDDIGAIAWCLPPLKTGPSVVVSVAGPKERMRSEEAAIIRKGRNAVNRFVARN